ncbi:hypothetical protein CH373_10090 [Leptospira perolatii]|uniref:Uncharacterized protein n=1 Tax=Leptospira perolatii TaxID=2023191 RepID=A0A2M9ZMK4_9LEPT|nr:hypothetical protein [Leptospira perolatii]PJZ70123.1 hypothetical protein CH360_07835 [Leptospira perolatii]PJZ73312.1 hypothetical protein CH373_10090 [Leptospira perolatii]
MDVNPFAILTKIREAIDTIILKLPPKTVKLLALVGVGLALMIAGVASYFSVQKGLEMADKEGQAKTLDRKILFLEDMEREYNRKRKNVQWSDPSLSTDSSSSLDIERYSQDKPKMEQKPSVPSGNLEEGTTLESTRRKEGDSKVFFPNESEKVSPSEKSSEPGNLQVPSNSGSSPSSSSDLKKPKEESRLEKPPKSKSNSGLRE